MTRPTVDVRIPGPGDLAGVRELWTAAGAAVGAGRSALPYPDEQVNALLGERISDPDTIVFLARADGRPVGLVLGRIIADPLVLDGRTLSLDVVFVVEEHRRRGIARCLLAAAVAAAERQGVERLVAGAAPAARDAHRFLTRLGFAPVSLRRVVSTTSLRRKLAGENARRTDDLLSRRRSVRARAQRAAAWAGLAGRADVHPDDDADADADAHGVDTTGGTPTAGPEVEQAAEARPGDL